LKREEKMSHKSVIKKAYSIPRTAPLYGRPPCEYIDNWMGQFLFKTTPEIIRELVPEPLVPNPDNLMLISLNRCNVSGFGSFNEVILAAPSTFNEITGQYAVCLYLDEVMPVVCGREVWGWPKKEARVTFAEKEAVLTATVERGGIELIRAAMELAELGSPEELQSNLPWFNLKMIPSVKRDAPPDVMQLTSTTFENFKVKQVYKGRATLEFGTSPVDPLHKIAIKEVQGGFYFNVDCTLTYGDVIYDYLAEGK
jgi:acetoacetate decarboxylase